MSLLPRFACLKAGATFKDPPRGAEGRLAPGHQGRLFFWLWKMGGLHHPGGSPAILYVSGLIWGFPWS